MAVSEEVVGCKMEKRLWFVLVSLAWSRYRTKPQCVGNVLLWLIESACVFQAYMLDSMGDTNMDEIRDGTSAHSGK